MTRNDRGACTCQHIALCHRYLLATGANSAECLAPACDCERYEESA